MFAVDIPGWNGWHSQSGRITEEMKSWMNEYNTGISQVCVAADRKNGNTKCFRVRFEHEEDAVAFKLRWT